MTIPTHRIERVVRVRELVDEELLDLGEREARGLTNARQGVDERLLNKVLDQIGEVAGLGQEASLEDVDVRVWIHARSLVEDLEQVEETDPAHRIVVELGLRASIKLEPHTRTFDSARAASQRTR